MNVAKHVRIASGVGYRMAVAGSGEGPSSRDMSSLVVRSSLIFGSFYGRLTMRYSNLSFGEAVNRTCEFIVRSAVIGAGATVVMDLWAAVLRRFGVRSLNFAFLGRWLGHLPRGRWFHQSIAKTAPIRRELLIGWCAHSSIGITFAAVLLAVSGVQWGRSPTLLPALVIGIVTVVVPLLVLQPALGARHRIVQHASAILQQLQEFGHAHSLRRRALPRGAGDGVPHSIEHLNMTTIRVWRGASGNRGGETPV